jgi:molybdopterin adenylyltransferase
MTKPVEELRIGLVSISDRASSGVYNDEGIPALEEWLGRIIASPAWSAETRLIPDEQPVIEQTLKQLVDAAGCHLVLTTGGTGPAARDITPEATLAVADKTMPGFGEQMRRISLEFVPTAILSRQVAVVRHRRNSGGPVTGCLIINLPGQPKSIRETLEGLKDKDGNEIVAGIFAAVPYCIDLIGGPYIETNEDVIRAFRPKSAIRPKWA